MRKAFFRGRTVPEIKKLKVDEVYTPRKLVSKILILGDNESLEIRTPLLPQGFLEADRSGAANSRKCYKHGYFIRLEQPRTIAAALDCLDIPLKIRMNSFQKALAPLKEEEIFFMGYSWYPVQGERRKRVIPFPSITDGVEILAYAAQTPLSIEVNDKYTHARRVGREGATILCEVPSRTQKRGRYPVVSHHIAIEDVPEKRAVVWSLRTDYEAGQSPGQRPFQDLRYTWESAQENSDIFTFGPHDIAAYVAIIGHFAKQHHNYTPFDMNPFALPSKIAFDFSRKVKNNIVIYDPTLQSSDKLRGLHLAERAILQSRLIKQLGTHETVYWDPARDGNFKDYMPLTK